MLSVRPKKALSKAGGFFFFPICASIKIPVKDAER